MTDLTLFLFVFGIQIVLLSAYFPQRILNRARYIVTHYPSSTHPKLYPRSSGFFSRSMQAYKWLHLFNFSIGWFIFYKIYTGAWIGENGVNPMLPWGYFMLQMLPSFLLEIFGLRLAKLMKKEDTRTVKSAQLSPRRFIDYISPLLLAAVVCSYFAVMLIGYYIEGFDFSLASKTTMMSGILFLGYAFFWLVSLWLIKGGAKNPYQPISERSNMVKTSIKTFAFTLIACCAFMVMALLISTYEMQAIMPVIMSVFLQLLVVISMNIMLNQCPIEEIDFDVYRPDSL